MSGLEWQIAEGSSTAHIIDAARPLARRTGRYGSGPRALCKRYPQRNNGPWFSLPVTEQGAVDAIRRYACTLCPECREADRG